MTFELKDIDPTKCPDIKFTDWYIVLDSRDFIVYSGIAKTLLDAFLDVKNAFKETYQYLRIEN
jgi:hypothetical protein